MRSASAAEGGDSAEMPSYKIRHSIATKVAAKKTGKGYILSSEHCKTCEMPLMMLQGQSSCKVCPAIKKWAERKNEGSGQEQRADDTRDVVEYTEVVTEIRDEAPVDPIGKYEKSNVIVESSAHYDLSKTDSTDSDDTNAIRERARKIIMNAKGIVDQNSSDNDVSMASAPASWDEQIETSESMEERLVRERAAQIIKQARMNLKAERKSWREDFPPEPVSTSHIHHKKSASLEEVDPDMVSAKAATIVKSILKKEKRVYDTTAVEANFEVHEQEKADNAHAQENEYGSHVAKYSQDVHQDIDGDADLSTPLMPAASVLLNPSENVTKDAAQGVTQDFEFVDVHQNAPVPSLDEILTEIKSPTANDALISEEQDPSLNSTTSTATNTQHTVATKPGGIFAGITSKVDDAIGIFQSLVNCNVGEIVLEVPFEDDFAHEPRHSNRRSKYDKCYEKVTYEVADTYHLNVISVKSKDEAAETVPSQYHEPEPTQAFGPQYVEPAAHLEMGRVATTQAYDNGAQYVPTMYTPQSLAHQNEVRQPKMPTMPMAKIQVHPNPNVTSSLPPPQEQGVIAPNHYRMLQRECVDSCGDANAQKQLEDAMLESKKLEDAIMLESKQLEDIMLRVKDAKMFITSQNTTAGVQCDDAKEYESRDANPSEQLDDAMLQVKDAKMFIMSRLANPLITPTSQTSTQLLINGMTPVAHSAPFMTQMKGYHAGTCFSRQGSLAPGIQENTSMHQLNVIANHAGVQASCLMPHQGAMTSGSPLVLRGMGSLMSPESATHADKMSPGSGCSPQMCANIEAANSGYRTSQVPSKFFFA
ncbi:hypothetical protein ACHAW5_004911 [Stephanodiscus triporus]|uniref:Uncharacterized protein n=1 Tax=Stephanodiscus triporus TaxID=2934178 RepID=A0ABD3N8F2_9STRA